MNHISLYNRYHNNSMVSFFNRPPLTTVAPQKHYRIVFIKAPTEAPVTYPTIPLQPPDEEKTLVYVLVKKPDPLPELILPRPATTIPTKPEVYFIRYKTQVWIDWTVFLTEKWVNIFDFICRRMKMLVLIHRQFQIHRQTIIHPITITTHQITTIIRRVHHMGPHKIHSHQRIHFKQLAQPLDHHWLRIWLIANHWKQSKITVSLENRSLEWHSNYNRIIMGICHKKVLIFFGENKRKINPINRNSYLFMSH